MEGFLQLEEDNPVEASAHRNGRAKRRHKERDSNDEPGDDTKFDAAERIEDRDHRKPEEALDNERYPDPAGRQGK